MKAIAEWKKLENQTKVKEIVSKAIRGIGELLIKEIIKEHIYRDKNLLEYRLNIGEILSVAGLNFEDKKITDLVIFAILDEFTNAGWSVFIPPFNPNDKDCVFNLFYYEEHDKRNNKARIRVCTPKGATLIKKLTPDEEMISVNLGKMRDNQLCHLGAVCPFLIEEVFGRSFVKNIESYCDVDIFGYPRSSTMFNPKYEAAHKISIYSFSVILQKMGFSIIDVWEKSEDNKPFLGMDSFNITIG